MKSKLFFIAFIATLLVQNIVFGQECSEILNHGIYDYSSISSKHDRAQAVVNWYKSSDVSSYDEAKKLSLSGYIPIDDILVGFGFDKSEKGFKEFQNYAEKYSSKSTIEKSNFDKVVSSINPNVVKAWSDCINTRDVHIWIEYTSNPKEFFLCANYIDNGAGNKPTIDYIDFGSNHVKNNEGAFMHSNGKKNKLTVLKGNTIRQIFTRTNDDQISIVVVASQGNGLGTTLPSINEKKLPSSDDNALFAICIDGRPYNTIEAANARMQDWITTNTYTINGYELYKLTNGGFWIIDGKGANVETLKLMQTTLLEHAKDSPNAHLSFNIVDLECQKNKGKPFIVHKENNISYEQSGDNADLPNNLRNCQNLNPFRSFR
jgi:hypothetical protein